MSQRSKIFVGLGLLGIVLIVVAISMYVAMYGVTTTPKQTVPAWPTVDKETSAASPDYAQGVKLVGIISSVSCYNAHIPTGDVGCSIFLQSSKPVEVSIMHGNTRQVHDWGRYIGFSDLEKVDFRGRNVEIFAHKVTTPAGGSTAGYYYTLEGSTDYYVRLLGR